MTRRSVFVSFPSLRRDEWGEWEPVRSSVVNHSPFDRLMTGCDLKSSTIDYDYDLRAHIHTIFIVVEIREAL